MSRRSSQARRAGEDGPRTGDTETRWVDAWNEVYRLMDDQWDVPCLLPDGRVVDAEACRGWLQETVYQGCSVTVEQGWVLGRRGIVVTARWES